MELPDLIAGIDAHKMQKFFEKYMQRQMYADKDDFGGYEIKYRRRFTPKFIASVLRISVEDAEIVTRALVAELWIDPGDLTPTLRGLDLARYIERPKIAQSEAKEILDAVLRWADRNCDPDSSVRVVGIELFGSLERNKPEVGEIGLIVELNTGELFANMFGDPDSADRLHNMMRELHEISDYISAYDQDTSTYATGLSRQRVFPRL